MYLVGILLVLLGALLVKKITGQKYRKSFFIIELPEYKLPSLKRATVSMLERGKAYIKKAGDHHPGLQHRSTDHAELHLAVPVGGGRSGRELPSLLLSLILLRSCPSLWASAYGSLQRRPSPAFIAKENVVGTLAVVYGVTNLIDTDELALVGSGNEVAAVMGLTKVAALAYLMFNLYTPPCFAALGAMNSEMKSAKWLWGGICLQLATGYTVAFFVYQIGTLITTGSLGTAFVPGLLAVIVFALIIIWRVRKSDSEFCGRVQSACITEKWNRTAAGKGIRLCLPLTVGQRS